MNEPLVNTLIPFKDNKGVRQRLFVTEMESVSKDIEKRAGELKEEVRTLFGDGLQIALVGRSDRGTTAYYWRSRSTKSDRKFRRLANGELKEYLDTLDKTRLRALRAIEEEIIYCNANLKAIKAMTNTLEKSNSEQEELRNFR